MTRLKDMPTEPSVEDSILQPLQQSASSLETSESKKRVARPVKLNESKKALQETRQDSESNNIVDCRRSRSLLDIRPHFLRRIGSKGKTTVDEVWNSPTGVVRLPNQRLKPNRLNLYTNLDGAKKMEDFRQSYRPKPEAETRLGEWVSDNKLTPVVRGDGPEKKLTESNKDLVLNPACREDSTGLDKEESFDVFSAVSSLLWPNKFVDEKSNMTRPQQHKAESLPLSCDMFGRSLCRNSKLQVGKHISPLVTKPTCKLNRTSTANDVSTDIEENISSSFSITEAIEMFERSFSFASTTQNSSSTEKQNEEPCVKNANNHSAEGVSMKKPRRVNRIIIEVRRESQAPETKKSRSRKVGLFTRHNGK